MIVAPITITPIGPFDLATADRFLDNWTPAAYERHGALGHVHLAFVVDGGRTAVAPC